MIIDTFPFNKDFNALEIRYQELKDVVDLFIASESPLTHSGLSKELHLSNNNPMKDLMGKQLVVLASTKNPRTQNPRTREMLQRQEITKYLKKIKLNSKDLIIHSDCDEIPRASVISEMAAKSVPVDVILELDNYANYINARDGVWPRGRIQSFVYFRSIQHMRADIFVQKAFSHRRHNLPFMRLTDFWSSKRFPFNMLPEYVSNRNLPLIKNAGWHFNNLIEEHEIIEKIESSCHTEWNTKEVKASAIYNYRNAMDIYTGSKHFICEIDDSYPKSITSNLVRWSPFIFK
jgi:hypothetical protein